MRNVRSKQGQQPSVMFSGGLKPVEELDRVLLAYTPDKQDAICKNEPDCFFGDHPTLATLNRDYDADAGVAWLIPQITDCVMFTNNRGILDDNQTEALARLIASEYYYLKVSELMFFFRRFKLGRYKQIYGNFSPMAITLSVREFLIERNDAYFKHVSKLEEEKRNKDAGKGISYQEYLSLKKKR